MSWIAIAEDSQKKAEIFPVERRIAVENLRSGDIFSINTQARKFEFRGIDMQSPTKNILARMVEADGSFSAEVPLDFVAHQGTSVIVWGHEEPAAAIAPYGLFEKVRMKSSEVGGIILDLDKSKFPECDIVVMWDQPIHGNVVTEVHGHEIESLGERFSDQFLYGSGDRSLGEIRRIVLELRANHEKKYDDETKERIQQQVQQALKEHAATVEKIDEEQKKEVQGICEQAVSQFASDFKAITDACVMFVSGGEYNYEADQIGRILSNYADSVYHRTSRLTRDPIVASAAAMEVLNLICASSLKSYYMTRLGTIRRHDGKWGVFTEEGTALGTYSTKKKAVHQLRRAEHDIRRGEISQLEPEEVDG